MDTKLPKRFFDNLFLLGLSNKAIIQENKSTINHQFSEADLKQKLVKLYPPKFKREQAMNDFIHLMNIRCIIYYGRIRTPKWTSMEILNYIQTHKDLGPNDEKYTIDYINMELSKWDQLNAMFLSKPERLASHHSDIKLALSLGYGMQEIESLFFKTNTTANKIVYQLSEHGINNFAFLTNADMTFVKVRRHIWHFKKAGLNTKRSRDLLCEYGYSFFTITDDIIELHFQWDTNDPKYDTKKKFMEWVQATQDGSISTNNTHNERNMSEGNTEQDTDIEGYSSDNGNEDEDMYNGSENEDMDNGNEDEDIDNGSEDEDIDNGTEDEDMDETNEEPEDMPLSRAFFNELLQ